VLSQKHIISLFFGFLFFSFSSILHAQTEQIRQVDSVSMDTVHVKNKERSKLRKFYDKVLFRKKPAAFPIIENINVSRKEYQGKVIRQIHYQTHDPFGYSLKDTTKRPEKWIERAGNTLHVRSKEFVLYQSLLFKKGERFDSVKISESERLIRSNRSIRRVDIKGELVGNDSVDLYVNSIDSWSMFVTGSLSSSKAGIRIRERNFLGMGHVFDNRYRHNYQTGQSLYQFDYSVPNIAQTRVTGNVNYYKDENEYYRKSVSFIRPFYSPLAHYAGGVAVGEVFFRDSLDFNKPVLVNNNFKYIYQDYWVAKAFKLNLNNNQITNLIVSGRYYNRDYSERPTIENDPVNFFSNQTNYMVGVGISTKQYIKTKNIYNFEIEEDIATGKSFGLIGSKQRIRQSDRYYIGGKASIGGFLNASFWAISAEYGGFMNKSVFEQKTLSIEAQYMSKLVSWGKWNFRNFVKANYLLGNNRLDSPADELSLNQNDYLGMAGFRADQGLTGQQKLMIEYQLQSYIPYQFLGFRVSPYFNMVVASISDDQKFILNKNPIYSRFTLGVMLTNDYFVFEVV